MSFTMKIWERVVEAKLKRDYTIGEQQCGFIILKSSIDALRLMENYRRTCTVFMDLEKTRDGVLRKKTAVLHEKTESSRSIRVVRGI